ncbi:MAG TPA: hypothetical protein VID19_07610 [Candidatus Eremiobacteraceae bacterium]
MRSEFVERGRSAREQLPVPELSMGTIRRRAYDAKKHRVVLFSLCGVIALIILGVGAAYGQKVYEGVRLWLSGGKAAVTVSAFAMVRQPMASDVRDAAARASFPVIFPVGLPTGTRLNMMMFSPAEHPTAFTILYGGALPTSARFGISVFDSTTVSTDDTTMPGGTARPKPSEVYQWQVGSETVIASKAYISLEVVNRIKAAMLKSSAARSLALTETIARKVWLEQGALTLAAVAERDAPDGRGVVLDRQHIGWIPGFATRRQPMIDSRTVFLTKIPTVNGEPDYAKAVLRWPKSIVISAGGVRAIDAVLRYAGVHANCGCGVLFDQAQATTYSVSIISMSASHATETFTVDARTFAVSALLIR